MWVKLCVCVYGGGACAHLNTCAMFSLFSPRTPNLGYSFETNSGNPFHYFSYGVACSEVEIDCLTGDHKVRSLQNHCTKLGERGKTSELQTLRTARERHTLWLGKIMSDITAWPTSDKGPASKYLRLSGPITEAREQPQTNVNERSRPRSPTMWLVHTVNFIEFHMSHHIPFIFVSHLKRQTPLLVDRSYKSGA